MRNLRILRHGLWCLLYFLLVLFCKCYICDIMVYSVCTSVMCVYLCVCMCMRHMYMCVTVFISCRMSLDLVETLLNIAETGNFDEVLQLFGAPLKQCPEILFFGLLQAKVSSTTIRSVWDAHTVHIICVSSPMDQQCRRSYCQD